MADAEVTTKRCCVCKHPVPTSLFSKRSASPDGLHAVCKPCDRVKKQAAYYRDVEETRARERGRVRDKEQMRRAQVRWRTANRELANKRAKTSTAKKPDYYQAQRKVWKRDNPEVIRAQDARRRALKAGAPGDGFTADDIAAIKLAQKGKCALCKIKLPARFHRDHIQPLSKGGAHCRRNLQLLCEPCNLAKHARDPIDHARTLGLLL